MIIYGTEVPDSHIQAGLAAMTGRFTRKAVADAERAAGAPYAKYLADKLIVREKGAGRIVRCDGGGWVALPEGVARTVADWHRKARILTGELLVDIVHEGDLFKLAFRRDGVFLRKFFGIDHASGLTTRWKTE